MPALHARDASPGAAPAAASPAGHPQAAVQPPWMAPCAAGFEFQLRVYWEDTDAGGVVFYANYLKFFERARTEWLRHLGVEQQALRHHTGAIFVVTDTQLSYHAPARLDDLLRVTVELRNLGTASMTFAQQAWRGETMLAKGQIRIACVDADSFRPRRVPVAVTSLLQPSPPRPAPAQP